MPSQEESDRKATVATSFRNDEWFIYERGKETSFTAPYHNSKKKIKKTKVIIQWDLHRRAKTGLVSKQIDFN